MDFKLPRTIESLTDHLNQWDREEYELIETHHPHGDGGMYQRDRIAAAARWACERFPGPLVEIGLLHGSTTVKLANVARAFNRKVLAIDPFTPGTQNVQPDTFDIFMETIKPHKDVIAFVRERSDAENVISILRSTPLAFVMVDGLHTTDAAASDLQTVAHASLIALDDTRAMSGVQDALRIFIMSEFIMTNQNPPRPLLTRDYWRETYIFQGGTENG